MNKRAGFRGLLMLCVAGLFATSVVRASDHGCFGDEFHARVERGMTGYADVAGIPGVSVGIVAGRDLVFTASVGDANRALHRKASPETLYNIASVTKVFTATLALMQVEEGTLDLDAPVQHYLPASVRMPLDIMGNPILVRHLLNHTSGLPKNPPNRRNRQPEGMLDPGVMESYDVADLYAGLAATKPESAAGSKFRYSNYGYGLLGHVVEQVAGKPYERVLRERLLVPLRMADTAIALSPEQSNRLAAFYWAEDPDRTEQTLQARYGEVSGFIGMTSSVRDLSRFVAAQLRPGGAEGNPVSAFVAGQMRAPTFDIAEENAWRDQMGQGWFLLSRRPTGEPMLFHNGEVDGHTAGIFLRPDLQLGVVVLQNLGGDEGSEAIHQFGQWLLALASNGLEAGACETERAGAGGSAHDR